MTIERKHLLAGGILLGLVVAVTAAWLAEGGRVRGGQAAPALSRPALTVRTTTLRADKWSRTLTANGSILPWQEAVISAQVQGLRIAEVNASLGDQVKRGDVLVTLDNMVRGSDAGTAHGVQGRIVAPDAGVISSATATAGTMVQPGMELFRLIRQGRLEWRAELTADELMLLHRGMSVEIVVGEGRVIRGKVRAISPAVNLQTRYGYALVALQDSRGLIAGAFARGTFDISPAQPVASLPQSAVLRRGSSAYVLVVGADHRVHERTVTTGQRNGERVQIVQGVRAGEPVVQSGGPFLTEGDLVEIAR